jgi:HK97 family phage prohead protease
MNTIQIVRKALPAEIRTTPRGFTAVITAETLDRDGEVLIPQGMNSSEFERNPILFWNHDYAQPVGKCLGLKRKDSTIVGDFQFAQRPDGYAGEFFPEVAAALVGQGIIKGVSVGYVPEDGGTRRASEVDRKKYGDRVHTVYSRWKLLEVSLAPLQSNPDALIMAVKKGLVSRVAAKRFFGIEVPRRVAVTVALPCAAPSIEAKAAPISIESVVRREVAKARGAIYLD